MSTRRKIGLVLITIGLILAFGFIIFQMYNTLQSWYGGLDGKNRNFDSWFAYFLSCSKGAIIISLAAGSIPFISGCVLLFAGKSKRLFDPNSSQPSHYTENIREIM